MDGQSGYLPPGLPFNISRWPKECQKKLNLDLIASGLIKDLYERRTNRAHVLEAIERVPVDYRAFFKERLNYWRDRRDHRGETK
ncbi:DNA polymerase III subunit theta [Yersinia similis]|uniref:DNA polymerase III subunit theta n=1 Tax=Yersinia similis TaxID=367190 RepID=UPI0005DBECCD|nr:DNA polymerase III subunit theta [Yersinia similis]CNG45283.1 DNA polymerase III subunit theta [Yersinia similis]